MRRTHDLSGKYSRNWIDIRTVLHESMLSRVQLRQTNAITSVLDAVVSFASANEIARLRAAVQPVELKSEDHVSAAIREKRQKTMETQQ